MWIRSELWDFVVMRTQRKGICTSGVKALTALSKLAVAKLTNRGL